MSEWLAGGPDSGCPIDEQLSQFLGGAEETVAAHVDQCAACQQRLDRLFHDSLAAGPAVCDGPQSVPAVAAVDTVSGADEAFLQTLISNLHEGVNLLVAEWNSPQVDTIRFPGPADERAPLGRLDRYEIIERVGSGGTGHLYRGWDPRLQRFVAIKILRGEYAAITAARDRFLREAHTAARIQHASMAAVFEVHSPDDFPPWIVQEFIEGESLQAYLRRKGPLPAEEAAATLTQILAALQAAHDRGIVHRDVKPSNVLLTADGEVKLVDFGLARLTAMESELTADGVIAGTPAYMSPEQALSPAGVDHRADIYSAGVVLYELLTGEQPFRGSVRRLLHDVVHAEPAAPRRLDDRIPRDLETVCLKALSKQAAHRYPTATAFQEDLCRYLQGQPVLARRITGVERAIRWSQRNPVVAGLSSVMAVGLLAGLVIWASFVVRVTTANSRLAETVQSLETSNSQLRTARRQAQRNAQMAQQQTNVAFEMVSALIFEVQQELTQQPGTAPMRRRLLSRALEGLDKVQVSAETETAMAVGRIMAWNRLGDALQGLSAEPSADVDTALRQYRNAFQQAERLLRRADETELTLVYPAVVISAWNLGDAYRNHGLAADARRVYSTGLKTAESWHAAQPDSPDAAYNRAVGLQRMADANGPSSSAASDETQPDARPQVRRQRLEESAAVLAQLQRQTNTTAVGWALVRVRFDLWLMGPVGGRSLQEIADIYDLLPATDVRSEPRPRQLLRAGVCVARAECEPDPVRAEELSREAIEILEATSKTFTDALAIARSSLAQALLAQDRAADAGTLFLAWGDAQSDWEPSTQVGYLLTRMAAEAARGERQSMLTSQTIAAVLAGVGGPDDEVLRQQRQKWMALRDKCKLASDNAP